MSKGWIKMHRSVLEHPWLNDRLDWCAAWSHILLSTNYETERVNLTEVYRTLSRHFTKDQWRAFVKKLAADDMLVDFKLENYGRNIGYVQDARVANWDEYQGSRSARSPKRSADAAHTQPETQRHTDTDNDHDGSARSPKRSADAAHTQPETLSYKNTSMQEVKEDKEGGARDDYNTSEARAHRQMSQGQNPNKKHSLRQLLQNHVSPRWLTKNEPNLERWTNKWPQEQLNKIWDATDLHYWPNAANRGASREHILTDLLDGEKLIPTYFRPNLNQNEGRKGHHPKYGEIEIWGVHIDGETYITTEGDYVHSTEVELWRN